jgi:hypothetical protein
MEYEVWSMEVVYGSTLYRVGFGGQGQEDGKQGERVFVWAKPQKLRLDRLYRVRAQKTTLTAAKRRNQTQFVVVVAEMTEGCEHKGQLKKPAGSGGAGWR